ncbi:MAG: methyl-accepting chemotaxis protein [Gallionellaceae bacterium]
MKFNLNIKTKLLAGFGLILFLLLVVTATSFSGITQLEERVAQAATKEYLLQRANSAYWALRLSQAQFPTSPHLWQKILDTEKPNMAIFYDNLNKFKTLREMGAVEKTMVTDLEENIAEYFAKRPEIYRLVQAGKVDEANEIRKQFSQPRGFEATKAMDQLLDMTVKDDKARKDELLASVSRIKFIVTLLGIITAAFAAFAAYIIVKSISDPLTKLQVTIGKIATGDMHARAKLQGRDELVELANQFDKMMDDRETVQAAIQKENTELNESVLSLLQAVAQLARKDLTVRVPVSENVTGAVADALNLLTNETAKVMADVNNISADVTKASMSVQAKADTMLAAAEQEREDVDRTADSLANAAQSMRSIADLAQACNTVADHAIKSTQLALSTVNSTVSGINSTRDVIRETEKRIKRLGERSQEISGVVNLINVIAERTHILALNASMHAASAGEAGRGFAVVADEVQRLAENARQATQQISALVSNIQLETADTVSTMNNAIAQIVEGSRLAEQAGQQMQLTQQNTAELVDSVKQIATSSENQAKAGQALLDSAVQIKKSSQQATRQLHEQAEQTSNLLDYAKQLLSAVRVFKLPA